MTKLIEDYLRKVEHELGGDPAWRAEIIGELRSHFLEKRDDLQRRYPQRDREAIDRQLLRDLGAPKDLALAYSPEGGTLLRSRATGEILLRIPATAARVGKAIGAGTKRAAEGTSRILRSPAARRFYDALPAFVQSLLSGIYRLLSTIARGIARFLGSIGNAAAKVLVVLLIVIGSLVGIALVGGIVLYDEIRDTIEDYAPRHVLDERITCEREACTNMTSTRSFSVGDAPGIRLYVDGHAFDLMNGSMTLRIADANDRTVYEDRIGAGGLHRIDHDGLHEARAGSYVVTFVVEGSFTGWIDVDVWTEGPGLAGSGSY